MRERAAELEWLLVGFGTDAAVPRLMGQFLAAAAKEKPAATRLGRAYGR
jgi:hypothetical protein